MLQLVFCILLLFPLIGLGIGGFFVSTWVGIGAAVISLVLGIPLIFSIIAHLDMMRIKSRYDLSDMEMKVFIRLVPHLLAKTDLKELPPKQATKRAKERAVQIIRYTPQPTSD